MKSGFVSLIGRPNVGKSTLLNNILNYKISITSNKSQTTRNNIQGIYNNDNIQIVFIDTPGIHKPQNKLGHYMNNLSYFSIKDVDIILFLVDVTKNLGTGDQFIINKLKEQDKPVILILNKIDKISKEKILIKINEYKDLYSFAEIIPLSALNKDNINYLIEILKKYLPDSIKYYNEDQITNVSTKFLIAELVREKVLLLTEDEVPHSVTCLVEKIEEKDNIVNINVVIVVERDNLKKIIIGNKGNKIKQIGINARKDIELLLNKKVYLELFVKTIKKWRDKEKYLSELGFEIE